jgi:hypothetical protein
MTDTQILSGYAAAQLFPSRYLHLDVGGVTGGYRWGKEF